MVVEQRQRFESAPSTGSASITVEIAAASSSSSVLVWVSRTSSRKLRIDGLQSRQRRGNT